jgi:hypothetical protein
MEHRHLNHQRLTLPAIDDLIEHGNRQDWVALRRAASSSTTILDKILRVCAVHAADPYAQRYHLWKRYAERHLS